MSTALAAAAAAERGNRQRGARGLGEWVEAVDCARNTTGLVSVSCFRFIVEVINCKLQLAVFNSPLAKVLFAHLMHFYPLGTMPASTKRERGWSDADSNEDSDEEEEAESESEAEREDEQDSSVPALESASVSAFTDSSLSSVSPVPSIPITSVESALYEDEDIDSLAPSFPSPRNCSVAHYKRQIKALQQEKKAINTELARYKIALANSNHALIRNGHDIPEQAKVTGGIVDSTEVANSQRSSQLFSDSITESIPVHEFPYRFDLTGIPDTSTIANDTKFPVKTTTFPHAVRVYQRTAEQLAPHVESRRPITLIWKLVNRRNTDVRCSERDLKIGVASPKIYFRLRLVYADDGTDVTMENLAEQGQHINALSEPNIICTAIERMQGGSVIFKIRTLNVLSSHTYPLHRKFRFELECIDQDLKKHGNMHASTFDFYSVARIRV